MKKQFRFTIYIGNAESVGEWRNYELAAFLKDCEAWAENECAFTAEFREV